LQDGGIFTAEFCLRFGDRKDWLVALGQCGKQAGAGWPDGFTGHLYGLMCD
jgi:hypothetical protein